MLQVHISGSVLISATHAPISKIFLGGYFWWKRTCLARKALWMQGFD